MLDSHVGQAVTATTVLQGFLLAGLRAVYIVDVSTELPRTARHPMVANMADL